MSLISRHLTLSDEARPDTRPSGDPEFAMISSTSPPVVGVAVDRACCSTEPCLIVEVVHPSTVAEDDVNAVVSVVL